MRRIVVLVAAAGSCAASAVLGCHASIATERPIPLRPIAAPAMVTIVGALELPKGEQLRTLVIEPDGTRTVLVVSQSVIDGLGPGAKTGAQVRVTGEPATYNGAAAIRVTSIMLVPR